jgi:hypothetical protein
VQTTKNSAGLMGAQHVLPVDAKPGILCCRLLGEHAMPLAALWRASQ